MRIAYAYFIFALKDIWSHYIDEKSNYKNFFDVKGKPLLLLVLSSLNFELICSQKG